ncbi:hypothetical protein ACIBQ1_22285 [Nonomuraea sp. NPDC050153]|uniref:hypothetical protein n=1 Tax=Nonomuraea sp. NPDC050153 TaxID=3364359 RepID=UPI00378E0BAC
MERNGCGAGCLVVLIVVTMPLVLVAGVLLAAASVSAARLEYRAAHGEGTMGTFTATGLDCSGRGPCRWEGVFESSARTRQDAWIYGYEPLDLSEGDRVPALDAGHDVKVFRPGHYDWPGVLLLSGLSLAALLLPAYLLRRALWKRPPRPPGRLPGQAERLTSGW